jgi:hypothetical protein
VLLVLLLVLLLLQLHRWLLHWAQLQLALAATPVLMYSPAAVAQLQQVASLEMPEAQ